MKTIIIENKEEKQKIAREILEALPEWFGIVEAREDYIKDSQEQMMVATFDQDHPVGFLCLKETGKDTVEVHVMGVLKQYHRQGIGRSLFEVAKDLATEKRYSLMQVKTVQAGRYPEYDVTNAFYQSVGFKEFEVFPDLWDEANPCQIYVMPLK